MEIVPSCRACLRPSLSYIDLETTFDQNVIGISVDIQPVQYTTFMDCFRFCTQLKAAEYEEEMPQSICEQCGFELGIAWNFLQKAVQTDKILRHSLEKISAENPTDEVFIDNDSVDATERIKEPIDYDLEYTKDKAEYESNTMDVSISQQITNEDYTIEVNQSENLSSNRMLQLSQNDEQTNMTTKVHKNSLSNLKFAFDDDYYVLEILDADITKEHDKPTTGPNQFEPIASNLSYENSIDCLEVVGSKEGEAISIYECSTCGETFESRQALSKHSPIHTSNETKNVICKICGQQITKEETMQKHLKNRHSNIVLDCTQCDYQCPAYKMSDHVQRNHDEARNFACNTCGKIYVSQSILNSHIKYHQRKEANIKSDACEICGKRFSTQHYLRLHMDVHRNERQMHQCEYCDKMYISKIALENHIRLHKGETIKCDQCGKEFVRQYELKVHMRFHTRDYPFKCEVCDKKFAIKGHLRTHMWRHQGLKLQCEECGKLFTSTKALQEHSFVHSEMPFPCTYCGRGYPSKQKFKVHLKTTHLIELTDEELLKITKSQTPKPLQRKKLTLVQADSVMKEVEVKDSEGETANDYGDLLVELS